MNHLFKSNDVLSSEMNQLLGGKKITVKYKTKDGKEISVSYEF